MHDFPANSQKAKARSEEPSKDERPEKIERVTSAEAVRRNRRKRGLGKQFKETFIRGNARMAAEYMAMEVVVPAIRDTVFDALHGGLNQLMYGDTRHRRGSTPPAYSNVGQVNYQGMSSPTNSRTRAPAPRMLSRQSRAQQAFDDIVIPTRTEAETVLDQMFEILSRYDMVTVAELYEMTGIQSGHTDHKWGWTNLRGAKVSRLRSGGYLLELPEPEALT